MIDFESALEYPLCSIPLSIANADGTPRKTTKSKLMTVIGRNCRSVLAHPSESRPQKDKVSAYIIDLMASIRSMVGLPDTYEDLTWKFLETLPKGYTRVDIVADTYQDKSIKATERTKRGTSREIKIRSPLSKIPRDFTAFLKNGKNKTRMILLMKVIIKDRLKTLELLACDETYFSTENDCVKLTRESCCVEDVLVSNQEEADTKVILHCKHALARYLNQNIILRSPSGDIDITVILIGKCIEEKDRCFIDFGSGKNRKGLWLGDIDMEVNMKECLIGFHAFTGNDYIT